MESVKLIKGGSFTDTRGTLGFVNEFTFPGVKRFYQIVHPDVSVVRAWQGHKVEQKYFYVPKGKFALAWVAIDNWDQPRADLKAEYVILKEEEPAVLSIPPGYANGIKALEPGSVLMVYSDLDLQQSGEDRWSFDAGLWLDWNKI
ncbi:hypothetical protein ACTJJ0_12870 [Chitinophaga sp. 22321]|uniref:dTDP-4-dehydrorhamnose 3,5-epimerase n=1 Tax=Chitinophaga hostae TaxID=2831022 RepID=A0ABS5J2N7_9BACT|nr:hypothetical protein [Chitinophaga hostae]MBS0028832.1 hypothetical protein [Chitinophaga hostae]